MNRTDLCCVECLSCSCIYISSEKNARRPDDLVNDCTFNTVDNKCTPNRHLGNIPKENFCVICFVGFFVKEGYFYIERCVVCEAFRESGCRVKSCFSDAVLMKRKCPV